MTVKTWDFLQEFTEALKDQLIADDLRWGDAWLEKPIAEQELHIMDHIYAYEEAFQDNGTPIPWLKIAGLALIAWIRENYRDGEVEGANWDKADISGWEQ